MLIFSGKQKGTSYIKLLNTMNHRKQIQKQTLTLFNSVLFIPLSLWSFTTTFFYWSACTKPRKWNVLGVANLPLLWRFFE